jgi:small GTP-binding protein
MSSTLKVTFIGDGAVGKTCIAIRMMENVFPEDFIPSVSDFDSRLTLEHAGTTVQLQIYDTMSREDGDRQRAMGFPGTAVCCIVFSLVNPVSFENVSAKWLPEWKHHLPDVPAILLAAKSDLVSDAIVLSKLAAVNQVPIGTEARKFAFDHGLVYVETSARTGSGIEELKAKLLELGLEHESKRRSRALSPARKPKCILL